MCPRHINPVLPHLEGGKQSRYIIIFIIINGTNEYYVCCFAGVDALSYDTNKIALDYHGIGFRECSAEVARYLVAVEGLDLQDPLRLRLLSHLQCYVAQHHHKTTSSWVSWGAAGGSGTAATPSAAGYGGHSSFQGHSMLTHSPSLAHTTQLDQSHMSAFTAPAQSNVDLSCGIPGAGSGIPSHVSQRLPTTAAGAPHIPHVSMATAASNQPYHSTYHLNLNTFASTNQQNLAPHSSSSNISSNVPASQVTSNVSLLNHPHSVPSNLGLSQHSVLHSGYSSSIHPASADSKPYRPWGAEIAY